jgi:anthranilate/para-aminobenzoate synthase component I
MEFSIAIRTIILKDGLAHFSVGGGIVADSRPDQEYEETLVKAQALFAALGVTPELH